MKFKEYKCGDKTIIASVGINLYVHATDLQVKISSPSLVNISAAAELGLAKTQYRIKTFGINPNNFYSNIPSAQFNTETYTKVIGNYDKIVNSLSDSTKIDPLKNEKIAVGAFANK